MTSFKVNRVSKVTNFFLSDTVNCLILLENDIIIFASALSYA